jgi:hypothetical protein
MRLLNVCHRSSLVYETENFVNFSIKYTVKKVDRFSRPQPGCYLPNSPWLGIFPVRESLVSDIPSGVWKI